MFVMFHINEIVCPITNPVLILSLFFSAQFKSKTSEVAESGGVKAGDSDGLIQAQIVSSSLHSLLLVKTITYKIRDKLINFLLFQQSTIFQEETLFYLFFLHRFIFTLVIFLYFMGNQSDLQF